MRMSPGFKTVLRQISTEIAHHDHQRIKNFAKQKNVSVQELLRQWLRPKIDEIKQEES